jgi:transposase InsO family protein
MGSEFTYYPEGRCKNLVVDASDTHIGAVLQQRTAAGWKPLAFFSKKLWPTESRYSAFDRELWAVFSGIRHFRYLLEGRLFHVLTDHKPLTTALHRVSEPWSAKQQRQLSYIAEYTADVRHIAGKENLVADALSRPGPVGAAAAASPLGVLEAGGPSSPSKPGTDPLRVETRAWQPLINRPGPQSSVAARAAAVAEQAQPVDFRRMAAEQAACAECKNFATGQSSLVLREFNMGSHKLLCDVSTGAVRPLVPPAFRRQVFDSVHSIAHPGTRATRRMLSARFVWPKMATDISSWCRDCVECARSKVVRNVRAPIQPIPVPTRRFSHVHVDLVGPLPVSREGFSYLFTMVDRSTRWAEAIPLALISAADCAAALFTGWVARFGVPELLTSDRGVQFTSAVWSSLCSLLGIQHIATTAYHPQANRMVERFHRQLKNSLRARLCGPSWTAHLPWVMLGLRAAPKEDSGLSFAEMVYGAALTLPGQFLAAQEPPPEKFLESLQQALSNFRPRSGRPSQTSWRAPSLCMSGAATQPLRWSRFTMAHTPWLSRVAKSSGSGEAARRK